MEYNVDSFNRLSLGMIEKDKLTPEQAMQKLQSLKLNLFCGEAIRNSVPLQAALLTAANTAARAFLGGVFVEMPPEVLSLLPWPDGKTLNEIVQELGGVITEKRDKNIFTLTFGLPASIDDNTIQVACNGWQGGVLTEGEIFNPGFEGNVPTGGIFAAGLAVALAFFKTSGIYLAACDQSKGISLWNPKAHWLDEKASGPSVESLPKKYWILGLGHLGQAYLWNIGLLPYSLADPAEIMLQDYEKIVRGNWSAGMLCKQDDKDYKTRICSQWLERRSFKTKITERAFDEYTKRVKEEPFLALCGFDNAEARRLLEDAGFDLVIEAGLGNSLHTFDLISFHTFPNASKKAKDIWKSTSEEVSINKVVFEVLNRSQENEDCGIVPLTIAGKSVSASFVGACAGALVIAEAIKALHSGQRYEKIVMQLRNMENTITNLHQNQIYSFELARNGNIAMTRGQI
jgi:hypothetical protein